MKHLITFTATAIKYPDILEQIKKLGYWGEVTPSSFFVVSQENAGVITERLQLLLGPQDAVAVFSVSQPWASHCDIIVEDLLLSKIGQDEDWIPHDWDEETQSRR